MFNSLPFFLSALAKPSAGGTPVMVSATDTATYLGGNGQTLMSLNVGTGKTSFFGIVYNPHSSYKRPVGVFTYSPSTGFNIITVGGTTGSVSMIGSVNVVNPPYTAGAGYNFDGGQGTVGLYGASYSGSTFNLHIQASSSPGYVQLTAVVIAM
jgi:hypothetical protein